jgi:hypothetical protein
MRTIVVMRALSEAGMKPPARGKHKTISTTMIKHTQTGRQTTTKDKNKKNTEKNIKIATHKTTTSAAGKAKDGLYNDGWLFFETLQHTSLMEGSDLHVDSTYQCMDVRRRSNSRLWEVGMPMKTVEWRVEGWVWRRKIDRA